MSPGRRQLVLAVLACALGAGLALLAAGRQWAVTVQVRPAPLAAAQISRTGAAVAPWLAALALVGLAGAGALVASRGLSRLLVGLVLVLVGAGVAAAGGYGLCTVAGVRPAWPVACLPAGALIAAAGVAAVRRRDGWPAMGVRYARPAGPPHRHVHRPFPAVDTGPDRPLRGGPSPSDVAMWDALDRGEDPTRPDP